VLDGPSAGRPTMTNRIKGVCVLGNLNIDLIIRNVPRLPVWGQEIAGLEHVAVSSGQAGYLALALSKLGIVTYVIGTVGSDAFGDQIMGDLKAYGVDATAVEVVQDGQTGITVALVRPDGERAFVSDFACLRALDEALVLRHWGQVEVADILCLVGMFCLPGLTLPAANNLLAKARGIGKATMLDTGWDPGDWPTETLSGIRQMLQHVTLFMPNEDEARVLSGGMAPEQAAAHLQALGPEIVVVKCGSRGSVAQIGSKSLTMPALPTTVFDAVGAGDIFDSGFLLGYISGWPPETCMAFGNAAASVYIGRARGRYPGLADVIAASKWYDATILESGKRVSTLTRGE